jgi:integrase
MEELKVLIREKRPNITDTSVKTYASVLKNLFYKDTANKEKNINIEWFKDTDKVIPILKDKPTQTRKTILAAIIVLLDGKAPTEYVDMMNGDAKSVAETYSKQEKTEKQEKNWIDYEDVVNLWNAKYKKVKPLLYSTDDKDKKEIREMINFMALTLTSGIFFTPRRSEWIYLKVRNYNPKEDNYLDVKNNQFVFNKYKTAKTIGEEKIPYPKEFKAILTRYLKFVDNDYLIYNAEGRQMSSVNLAQLLNKMYDKEISTTMLRHIYLTHKFKDLPALKDLKEAAQGMGQKQIETMLEYVKNDKKKED